MVEAPLFDVNNNRLRVYTETRNCSAMVLVSTRRSYGLSSLNRACTGVRLLQRPTRTSSVALAARTLGLDRGHKKFTPGAEPHAV